MKPLNSVTLAVYAPSTAGYTDYVMPVRAVLLGVQWSVISNGTGTAPVDYTIEGRLLLCPGAQTPTIAVNAALDRVLISAVRGILQQKSDTANRQMEINQWFPLRQLVQRNSVISARLEGTSSCSQFAYVIVQYEPV